MVFGRKKYSLVGNGFLWVFAKRMRIFSKNIDRKALMSMTFIDLKYILSISLSVKEKQVKNFRKKSRYISKNFLKI